MDGSPLIIVSNRGPAQFERDEAGERTVRRGGGGLVTALSGLVSHRDALWIASAMTDEDIVVSEENGGKPIELALDGIDYRVCLVGSDAEAYDRFYNVIANPILWFIQHYLWDLSNAPDIRQEELDAWDLGYQAVNRAFYKKAELRLTNDAVVFTNAGAPVNGTTLDNVAGKGSLCIDVTNGKLYINTGTITDSTWTVVGSQT